VGLSMYRRKKVLIKFLTAVFFLSFFSLAHLLYAEDVTVPASSMPSNPIYANGRFYFIAYSTQPALFSHQMARLWSTDGTPDGTRMLNNMGVDSINLCDGPAMVARNDRLIFAAKDESAGEELWFYDAKTQEAGLIKDIYPGKADSLPCILANANGVIFFLAFDNPHRASLWKTDGTISGTVKIKDNLSPKPDQAPIVVGNTVFFVANDDVHGFELWKSDGTSVGTFLVKDIAPGAEDSNIGTF
jgi:ELWxxDGT repeat protein